MIALLFLALGLGAALTAYEFSPSVRSQIDIYVRAIRDAHAAHQRADQHLATATHVAATAARHAQQAQPVAWSSPFVPGPPVSVPAGPAEQAASNAAQIATNVAIDHVAAAQDANQDAARATAAAAAAAQSAQQLQAAADSAAVVDARQQQITAALASLGVGQCGVRSYARVSDAVKDALLMRLAKEGMNVTGDNPWNIATHQYDVTLRAVWDPGAQIVKLIVTAGQGGLFGLVTCDEIWKKIDPIMKEVIG